MGAAHSIIRAAHNSIRAAHNSIRAAHNRIRAAAVLECHAALAAVISERDDTNQPLMVLCDPDACWPEWPAYLFALQLHSWWMCCRSLASSEGLITLRACLLAG